jgi:heme exporter protein C
VSVAGPRGAGQREDSIVTMPQPSHLSGILRVAGLCALLVAGAMAIFHAPIDEQMGPVQKLIYLHLPAAILSFVSAMVVFVASLGFLWTRQDVWNRVARAAGIATVLCSATVLATGMIWAHFMWGLWWTWSPRLTFTLVMCVLYAGYLLLRRLPGGSEKWDTRCAVFGCVMFLDVPLVYLSIRLLPDVHPTSIPLTAAMRETLIPCYLAVGLGCAQLILSPVLNAVRKQPPAAIDHADASSHGTGNFRPQT